VLQLVVAAATSASCSSNLSINCTAAGAVNPAKTILNFGPLWKLLLRRPAATSTVLQQQQRQQQQQQHTGPGHI